MTKSISNKKLNKIYEELQQLGYSNDQIEKYVNFLKSYDELYNTDIEFNLLSNVIDDIFDYEYELKPVPDNHLDNISTKNLYYMFNSNKIINLPKHQQLKLFSEVNKRICKTLQIAPSVFKEATKFSSNYIKNTAMYAMPYDNTIYVDFKNLKSYEPQSVLQIIFHETYHTYQFQTESNCAKGIVSKDTDNIISNFSDIVFNTLIDYDDYTNENLNKNLNTELTPKQAKWLLRLNNDYFFNLPELEANLFASNMMKKLNDKGIVLYSDNIRNFFNVEISANYAKFFTRHNIEKEKHLCKKYLSDLKHATEKYDYLLCDEYKNKFVKLFEVVTPKAIEDYYNNKASKMREEKSILFYEDSVANLKSFFEYNMDISFPDNEDI